MADFLRIIKTCCHSLKFLQSGFMEARLYLHILHHFKISCLYTMCSVVHSCLTLCDPMDCYVACLAPLPMEFSRQEYWTGLPLATPRDLPNPEIQPMSPALQADSLPSEPSGKPDTRILVFHITETRHKMQKILYKRQGWNDSKELTSKAIFLPWLWFSFLSYTAVRLSCK